ncbi:MAG: hypothetical protein RBT62_10475 [Spirochaetia bacterium]|jgi:hypothetical protein|nr:hypothetical protein [Spirochaetia bacterium]
MKKTALFAFIALALILVLGSCSTFNKTTNGALGYGKISGSEKGHFEARGPVTYILHPSLVSLKDTNERLDEIIQPALEAKGANAATNLVIENGFDTIGFLVRYITGGLVGLDYVKVSGTAIKQ